MMGTPFERTALLLGDESMKYLANSHVAVFGIGGVGGHCCDALARCGIGAFTLIDPDTVSVSNINRQAVARHSTLGQYKTDVMREMILDINPQARVRVLHGFYAPEDRLGIWENGKYSLVVDAIDTISAKIDIISCAQARNIPVISCMGAGNKRDPSRFEIADLFDTSVCPLCRVMRKVAKEHGITKLPVVYSKEPPCHVFVGGDENGRHPPASISFVTASAGLLLASEGLRLLLERKELSSI